MTMSISEWQLVQDLKRRLETLERERKQLPQPRGLRRAIGAIVAAHRGPAPMLAKQVESALAGHGWAPMPALRTIRWHLQQIRSSRGNASLPSLPPQ